MKQVVQNMKTGQTEVIEVPAPGVRAGCVLVRTAASLVSAGTERNLVEFAEKSLVGKARSRPDLVKQVVDKARREGVLTTLESALNRLDQPLALGYSSSGIVEAVGRDVKSLKPGDRVVCAGGSHAVHAEFAVVPVNLAAKLPDNVAFESGAFATLGAIALNGIRLANPQLGEKTAIIGLGLMGLITAQLVQAAGCEVAGFDIDHARIRFARGLGIKSFSNSEAEKKTPALTRGRGFDHVLICADTRSNETVELAGMIARDRARVISIGVVGLELPRKLYYEKELAFRVSRSSGPGRYDEGYEEKGLDYPIGYVRWTEGRNLEAFVDLLAQKKIEVHRLITHRFSIEDAAQAYELITGKTDVKYLAVLLTYPLSAERNQRVNIYHDPKQPISKGDQKVTLGVVGAGNYAGATFLPAAQKNTKTQFVGIASTSGTSAQTLGRKFGFDFTASNPSEILDHQEINTVAILTRHDSHAHLTLDALQKGKNVYCEKPLSLDKSGLKNIEKELAKPNHPYLMVGFNRRFAPFSITLKGFFPDRTEPMYAHYRVNAGFLPPSHWLNDLSAGGGRLVGEGCHFIDYLTFLTGQPITQISASGLPNSGKYSNDNLMIRLDFQDGSIGTIAYLANGCKSFPKEYVEVFCEGKVGILDDFRQLTLVDDRKKHSQRSAFRQNKGHRLAWEAFSAAIMHGGREPIPYLDLMQVSYAALAGQESLLNGQPVNLAGFIRSESSSKHQSNQPE
jgi:predicted dehydrogenase/threonine dehydrogenase-like Zn-dependent dehydrogenase